MAAGIYIIRHGQTEMNSRKVLQGRSDLPLNAAGVSQAEETAALLRSMGVRFDRVFSSPLIRAVRTAELLAPGLPVEPDFRLIEMDYGPYEGMDLLAPAPEVLDFFRDFVHNRAPEGMEPLHAVVERAGAFLESLRGLNGNILISTHAIAMKGILEYLTPGSGGAYWSKHIGNCAVYRTESDGSGFSVPCEIFNPANDIPGEKRDRQKEDPCAQEKS